MNQTDSETSQALVPAGQGELAVRRREQWKDLVKIVKDGVASERTKKAYGAALEHFYQWSEAQPNWPPFAKATILSYKARLEADKLAAPTINVKLAALKKLASEAVDNRSLAPEIALGIAHIKGVKRLGERTGHWLTLEEAQRLLRAPMSKKLEIPLVKRLRDRAILAVLLGCALRRSEVAALELERIQQREGRWVIVDLLGKGNRRRSVPMPAWVKTAIDAWTEAAGITSRRLFRSVNKGGRVWGDGLTERVIWQLLPAYAAVAEIKKIAPHDLRRTCAKLCRDKEGKLEQIQLMLGHASVVTTERYLGTSQDLQDAPNDRIGLRLAAMEE